jgi:hypothetical protein
MTLDQLLVALQAAKDRGLPGSTTVVIDHAGWYSILESVEDPSSQPPNEGPDMWVTLYMGEPADARWTPGGMPDADDA